MYAVKMHPRGKYLHPVNAPAGSSRIGSGSPLDTKLARHGAGGSPAIEGARRRVLYASATGRRHCLIAARYAFSMKTVAGTIFFLFADETVIDRSEQQCSLLFVVEAKNESNGRGRGGRLVGCRDVAN
jgi:hypothetical protein